MEGKPRNRVFSVTGTWYAPTKPTQARARPLDMAGSGCSWADQTVFSYFQYFQLMDKTCKRVPSAVQNSNHLTCSLIRGAWVSLVTPPGCCIDVFAAHPAPARSGRAPPAPCPWLPLPLRRQSSEPSPFFTDRRLRNPATHHHPVHAIRLPPRVYFRLEHHCCVLFG